MPCALYDAAGTFSWTWPAGVTQAFVSTRGASAGGGAGTIHRGAGAGGGGAFAAKLLTRTDATATVVVGAGGAGATALGDNGAAGGGSTFSQASTSTEICGAAGGGAPSGPTGGTGGAVADSDGDIIYAGGNGGSRDGGDGGGGGGAAACETAGGANGANESAGGAGGQVCPGTAADGTGGGNGGTDGLDGANGEYGGGGGGGTNAHGGNGSGGRVLICWAEPVPTGYCYARQCWWPNCGYYGGYNCYYYGQYPSHFPTPYGGYGYGPHNVSVPCCPGVPLPTTLNLTISTIAGTCAALDGLTVPLTFLATGSGGVWTGVIAVCPDGTILRVTIHCLDGDVPAFSVSLMFLRSIVNGGTGGIYFFGGNIATASCAPVLISAGLSGGNDLVVTAFGAICGCATGTFSVNILVTE